METVSKLGRTLKRPFLILFYERLQHGMRAYRPSRKDFWKLDRCPLFRDFKFGLYRVGPARNHRAEQGRQFHTSLYILGLNQQEIKDKCT